MTGFPFCSLLPTRPDTRAEHKIWVDAYMSMSIWCAKNIVDHWGADDKSFYFSFENDLNRFNKHFGIKE